MNYRHKAPASVTSLPFTPTLARPLPHTVTPFPNETISSYFSRLAAANRSDPDRLRFPSRWLRCPLNELELLERLSGQPRTTLVWAIPELRHHAPKIAPPLKSPGILIRPACRRCTWRSGGTHQVQVHVRTLYYNVCIRHSLWLADGANANHEQIDLTPTPEIIHAQIRLNRLERQHGQRFVAECFRQCERLWTALDQRGLVRSDTESVLHRLHGRSPHGHVDRFGPIHRFRRAARFPQIARFTALVASFVQQPGVNRSSQKAAHIVARFRQAFTLDYEPRKTTGPWIRDALITLAERMEADARRPQNANE